MVKLYAQVHKSFCFFWTKHESFLKIIDNIDFKVFITSPDHVINMAGKYSNKFIVFFSQ